MNANKQDVGGLPLLQFAVFDEFGKGADDRVWDYGRRCFEAGELCRAAPAGGDVECFVREMRTSKGAEFFVVVKRDGRELTPHMYTERWKAEYDVASWQHLLCGAPEPDLLAYGPSDVSAPAGAGEVHPIPQELFDRAHRLRELAAANRLNECLPTIETMCGKNAGDAIRDAAALLRKLQQGAGEGREG